MRYKKKSTGESLLFENGKNIVTAFDEGFKVFILRSGIAAASAQRVYEGLRSQSPEDFSDVLEADWVEQRSAVLGFLASYEPPSSEFYIRPADKFIYCWNEETLQASVLTNPDQETVAFLTFFNESGRAEIEKRKAGLSKCEKITRLDWLDRRDRVLSILNNS